MHTTADQLHSAADTAADKIASSPAHQAFRILQFGFTVAPILAGLDKFFHLLTNWDLYLSPMAQRILGGLSHPFMLVVGVVEMIVGLLVITNWTRLGAYIASVWLL